LVTATITQPTEIIVDTLTTPSNCGLANGTISTTTSGGEAPYTYLWTSIGSTTNNVTGLPSGIYFITATDATGCTQEQSAAINDVSAPVVSFVTLTQVTCLGGSNGTAEVTVTGTSGPYTYSWFPIAGTGTSLTGLPVDKYYVTVLDAFGCKITVSDSIRQIPTLGAVITNTLITCFGGSDGSAVVFASGGTTPYTYSWQGGSNSSIHSGLSTGTYSVTVTDANNCAATQSITIQQPTQVTSGIASSTSVNCFNGTDGSATVTATGGTTPYQYDWIGTGVSTAILQNKTAGTYTVIVSDAHNCTSSTSLSITAPTPISAVTQDVNAYCNGANGQITSTVSGGVAPYSYNWSPTGGNNSSATGLSQGTYTLSITDSHGCMLSVMDTVKVSDSPQLDLVSTSDINCFGGNLVTFKLI
jgi:hypothetical protein